MRQGNRTAMNSDEANRGMRIDEIMDPRAFLALAKRLVSNEKNAEGRRSAISRAYYAAFNVAVEFCASIGCHVPNGPQGHELAYNYLNNCGDSDLIDAASSLHNLRGERNIADYKLTKKYVESEDWVHDLIKSAEEIIKSLDDCKNGSAKRREDVKKAIRIYMQLRAGKGS